MVSRKFKTILLILAVAILIAAAFGVLWFKGVFLPSWVEWGSRSYDLTGGCSLNLSDHSLKATDPDGEIIWSLDNNIGVQDMLISDIDMDGVDELSVLCWKIGRYGDRKPFWVDMDELKWSQHIYIYEINSVEPEGDETALVDITPKWMASDIHTDVAHWEVYEDNLIKTISPDGDERIWMWDSWGLTALTKEQLTAYINKKNDGEKASEKSSEEASDGGMAADGELQTDNSENSALIDNENDTDEPDTISVIMVGDILLHDGITAACRHEDGTYDFAQLFENTEEVIHSADIAIVNQEVILGGEELRITGYPTFNAPYEVADALENAGFDVVCHATNHALDRGKKGIINCLSNYRENHPALEVLGIYDNEEDSKNVYIREVGNVKIAILNYTYGTNGIPMPEGMSYAVSLLDKEKMAQDLSYAEENADFTIVCPHWGIEYQLKESRDQDALAEFMAENGADLIIGTHPHVIEPVKWVEAENGNRALCYYSLGNYINWTSGRGANVANRMVGGMAYVELSIPDDADETDAALKDWNLICDFAALPLVSHVEHEKDKVTTYFLEDYTEDEAEQNAIREQDPEFDLEYCYTLCGTVWEGIPQNLDSCP